MSAFRVQSGKHMLALSFSGFDAGPDIAGFRIGKYCDAPVAALS